MHTKIIALSQLSYLTLESVDEILRLQSVAFQIEADELDFRANILETLTFIRGMSVWVLNWVIDFDNFSLKMGVFCLLL